MALLAFVIGSLGVLPLIGFLIAGFNFIIAFAPWLLFVLILFFFMRSVATGENKKFWRGSDKIKGINAISLIGLISSLMYVAEWEFLVAFLLSAICTLSLDVMLYHIKPELFD